MLTLLFINANRIKRFASEMKALATECARFEPFLPGHFYSSKQAKMSRWYNPMWREPTSPFKPYDKVSLINFCIHTLLYILQYVLIFDRNIHTYCTYIHTYVKFFLHKLPHVY